MCNKDTVKFILPEIIWYKFILTDNIIHEFVCPYNLSISGKRVWLDVCNGGLRETILLKLW